MISANHLHLHYGDTTVLNDVSFEQQRGTVTAIIGPSGSGKTTLLRTLNALSLPQSGSIQLNDVTFDSENHTKKDIKTLRDKSAMVFQNYNLFKNKTIIDNITEGLIYGKKMKKDKAQTIAHDYLERVGLLEHQDKYPVQLSGGQSQRVGIIRALALNPDVLLLDEPTSALDPESVQSVLQLIQSIAQNGMTMTLVTHEIQFAKAIADQILFIDQGRIIQRGTPTEVLEESESERIQRFLSQMEMERDRG
ncbi:amino acid ABC transporter ATP-binding protein [Staphylococcus auricularis]|uniref:amino acid ABC transporter ATP-binding protein n=1 Tax=Staphylococcus auricularis TaxID=29379 RepID=UPI00242AD008|nr:amino acid ABC transporter ATP-binding protein [Staphylococcus auricularis]